MLKSRPVLWSLALLFFPMTGKAQSVPDELSVSYIYSAVMGTGTYKIDDRRISMLRMPFAWTQQEMTEEDVGIKWHMPVVLGYDALNYPDWLDRLLEDDLVTLTVLPGIEVKQALTDYWVFKPFINVGAGYDFTRNETILMGVLGIRGLGTWKYEDASELRAGMSGRYAAEYQINSGKNTGFTMFEGGVDYRRDTHLRLFRRATNAGVYYRAQLFVPEWELNRQSRTQFSDLSLINEIGASIGFEEPKKLLGISWSRVRAGYTFGQNVRGWTFGTEFPF